jgi:hypothetical protein
LAFVADFGTQNFHLKTKFDMENKTSTNHENGNEANRLLADSCIKFRKVRVKHGFSTSYTWKGRKKGFCFEISLAKEYGNTYYSMVTHTKKDIRFNSLWSTITFATLQDAFDWCDAFESKNFSCLGADA